MLFSFNYKKKQEPAGLSEAQNRIARNIVYRCIRWQSKWAARMQYKTEHLSARGKVMILSLFCLLAGGYSLYLITSSFSGKPVLPLTSIGQPRQVHSPDDIIPLASVVIAEEKYQEIQRFRQYIDSLAQTSSGKKFNDSVLLFRKPEQSHFKK